MTLSDLQGHAPIARLSKCDFSYNCAAADKISTDITRRVVPLRYLSFFRNRILLLKEMFHINLSYARLNVSQFKRRVPPRGVARTCLQPPSCLQLAAGWRARGINQRHRAWRRRSRRCDENDRIILSPATGYVVVWSGRD